MHAEHAGGCPCEGWDYESYDVKNEITKRRCIDQLIRLRTGETPPLAAADTRPTHAWMFKGLTHPDCPYFAGNYRGSRDCLIGYEVSVGTATTEPSAGVFSAMEALGERISDDLALIQAAAGLKPAEALIAKIDVILDRMVEFLTIHPYANGNGHMQRFVVWCFLAAIRIWPKRWPLDTRLPRPYDDFIAAYRIGAKDPLRTYVLELMLRK